MLVRYLFKWKYVQSSVYPKLSFHNQENLSEDWHRFDQISWSKTYAVSTLVEKWKTFLECTLSGESFGGFEIDLINYLEVGHTQSQRWSRKSNVFWMYRISTRRIFWRIWNRLDQISWSRRHPQSQSLLRNERRLYSVWVEDDFLSLLIKPGAGDTDGQIKLGG